MTPRMDVCQICKDYQQTDMHAESEEEKTGEEILLSIQLRKREANKSTLMKHVKNLIATIFYNTTTCCMLAEFVQAALYLILHSWCHCLTHLGK